MLLVPPSPPPLPFAGGAVFCVALSEQKDSLWILLLTSMCLWRMRLCMHFIESNYIIYITRLTKNDIIYTSITNTARWIHFLSYNQTRPAQDIFYLMALFSHSVSSFNVFATESIARSILCPIWIWSFIFQTFHLVTCVCKRNFWKNFFEFPKNFSNPQ